MTAAAESAPTAAPAPAASSHSLARSPIFGRLSLKPYYGLEGWKENKGMESGSRPAQTYSCGWQPICGLVVCAVFPEPFLCFRPVS
jgi:hypothetical protein